MEEKTYIIVCEDKSRRRITVPADWKITFGPAARGLNGGRSNNIGGPKMPMALRFYESETKQRAIFTDVVNFYDSSIKIEEEKVKIQEKDGYTEFDGVRKRTTFQATVREWVDPNTSEEPKPILLPSDTEMFLE